MNRMKKAGQLFKKNFDEISILSGLALLSNSAADFDESDYIIQAIRRSTSALKNASISEISDYIRSMNDSQIPGFANNIKGIAHEIYFVDAENSDGDSIEAVLFPDTNHADYDVQLIDTETGDTWDVQLKATDYEDYVKDAIENIGDQNIIVTDEIAEKLNLMTSGISNQQLEMDVKDFVDQMESYDDPSIWSYIPFMSIGSILIIISELYNRYNEGSMSAEEFKTKIKLAIGKKVLKFTSLGLLMTVPILGPIISATMLTKLIYSVIKAFKSSKVEEGSRSFIYASDGKLIGEI